MINLRVLTEEGIDRFGRYIQNLRNDPNEQRPDLNTEPFSIEFNPVINIDDEKTFTSKMELGKYLAERFDQASISRTDVIGNRGLWSWMSYLWFDQLCPLTNGSRTVLETAKYICSSDYRNYYRHYIAVTYDIFSLHGEDNARLFLYNPVYKHNDFVEQLASRQNIISNLNLVRVAHQLYWDSNGDRPKRGAQSRNRQGTLRRLIRIFAQLELTFDIYIMNPDEIMRLLPSEFNEWIN